MPPARVVGVFMRKERKGASSSILRRACGEKTNRCLGGLEASPCLPKPPVPETLRVGRVEYESPAGPQHAAALLQKACSVVGVLQDVVEGDLVGDASGKARLLEAA